jgi:hypothetical protein
LIEATDHEIRKALVAISIKKSLQGIGKPVYEEVTKRLEKHYHCYIPDCYENPEYLNRVLKELYGNAHINITRTIRGNLESFSHDTSIHRFILQIR